MLRRILWATGASVCFIRKRMMPYSYVIIHPMHCSTTSSEHLKVVCCVFRVYVYHCNIHRLHRLLLVFTYVLGGLYTLSAVVDCRSSSVLRRSPHQQHWCVEIVQLHRAAWRATLCGHLVTRNMVTYILSTTFCTKLHACFSVQSRALACPVCIVHLLDDHSLKGV